MRQCIDNFVDLIKEMSLNIDTSRSEAIELGIQVQCSVGCNDSTYFCYLLGYHISVCHVKNKIF